MRGLRRQRISIGASCLGNSVARPLCVGELIKVWPVTVEEAKNDGQPETRFSTAYDKPGSSPFLR